MLVIQASEKKQNRIALIHRAIGLAMAGLDVSGMAYLCWHDDSEAFTGILITTDKHQYSIQGHPHHHDEHDTHCEAEDEHTCCYDDTARKVDLTISQLDDLREDLHISHVVRSGGDNWSLTSPSVEFITDDLLVGGKADAVLKEYLNFPPELLGKDYMVCVGEMTIKYPPL